MHLWVKEYGNADASWPYTCRFPNKISFFTNDQGSSYMALEIITTHGWMRSPSETLQPATFLKTVHLTSKHYLGWQFPDALFSLSRSPRSHVGDPRLCGCAFALKWLQHGPTGENVFSAAIVYIAQAALWGCFCGYAAWCNLGCHLQWAAPEVQFNLCDPQSHVNCAHILWIAPSVIKAYSMRLYSEGLGLFINSGTP